MFNIYTYMKTSCVTPPCTMNTYKDTFKNYSKDKSIHSLKGSTNYVTEILQHFLQLW